ncbi:MAG: SpoIIE family protein phosphatase [Bacteroidales bacterium]|nr:SpoIIE family protein phosphatase [Bacteroidales bacterium]
MRKLIHVILLLLLNLSLIAQIGKPFIRNYSPNEYLGDDQIWTILQDQRGVMYFGGIDGLFEYNGVNWNKYIITDAKNSVLSSAIDENGTIFIGSEGEFGCMMPDHSGRLKYISFINELDSADRLFTNVWSVAETDGNVYFSADEAVFRYNRDSLPKVKKIYSEAEPFLVYKPNDEVFFTTRKGGFMKIEGDNLISMPGIEGLSVWFMLPYETDKYLIGSSENGLEIYHPNAGDSTQVLSKYNSFNKTDIDQTNKFLQENQMYMGACQLDKNRYAIGTILNGIIIINKKGKIVEHINKKSDLQNSTIHFLLSDKQNELWVGTSYGISRVEFNSPFRILDEKSGVLGTIYDIIRFKNRVYATSNIGMYYFDGKKFKGIKALTGENSVQVFLPLVCKNPYKNDSVLLVYTIYGIYYISGNEAIRITEISPSGVFQSEFDKTKFYCSVNFDLLTFSYDGKNFTKPKVIQRFNEIVYTGIEKDANNIWLIIVDKPAVFNVEKSELVTFNSQDELKGISFNNIIKIAGETIFLTDKGIYKFSNEKEVFYKDSILLDKKLDSKTVMQVTEVSRQLYWTLLSDDSHRIINQSEMTESGVQFDSIPFKRLFGVHTIYADGDSLLWAISSEAIYRYNLRVDKDYSEKSTTVISKITISGDSVVFYGAFSSDVSNKKQRNNIFSYSDNDISFEFTLPSFDNESANEYCYLLEGGKSQQWSNWTNETYKEYTNLYEGKYVFKVKARNIYDLESSSAEYEFEILPPWYRTWWAYAIYLLLLFSLISIIIKLNEKRLKKENVRLDNIVKERTAEIYLQKEEIQTQADHLEEINTELSQKNEEISSIAENLKDANKKIRDKNIYITDSINYAKKIQTAVLPDENEIKSVLKDYFIIYRPKDIVGGDFYFVKKINNYIVIAVADCTGHGVPGGFLSMMGISILNEIVQKDDMKKSSDVLEVMRDRIKNSLRQRNYLLSRTEGIDIALCAINTDNNVLQYSGANIPAFIIRNNEEKTIDELKPDLQPVGIHYNEKPFSYFETKIEAGDMLYLFSDGIYDQFGGNKNRKFLISNLKILLKSVSEESVKIQRRKVLNKHLKWKGNNKQVDDILVLGLKYSG